MSLLFLLKMTIPPLLVAAVSLASRRWGPTVGALLIGLPWLTGPVLVSLTLDKGLAFGAAACAGIELGVVCLCAYLLVYGAATILAPWPVCIALASAAFAIAGWSLQSISLALEPAAGLAATGLVASYLLLPRPATNAQLAVLPWWDVPARMLATVILVGGISAGAERLGPQLSGIVATFPVVVSVVGTFTHRQWGGDAIRRMLRALALSLLAFVAFFLVVGWTLTSAGLVISFALGSCAALSVSTALLVIGRRRRAR
jgi:hypothetical protein